MTRTAISYYAIHVVCYYLLTLSNLIFSFERKGIAYPYIAKKSKCNGYQVKLRVKVRTITNRKGRMNVEV
jgi:hypothetical protein